MENGFIEKAILKHGKKYDYSKVEYKNNTTKVCIICSEHGEFWQTPRDHLNGCGCPKCSILKRRLTTEQFIDKARKVHGDKYDYSKVEYINSSTKVCIICPIHGEFWQRPQTHLKGHGCSLCIGNKKSNTEEFIEKANKIHGDKYDFSKVTYVNNRVKVCVICKTCSKEFLITPHHILQGQGCPKCAQKNRNDKNRSNTQQFIDKARKVHGDKYDYSKVQYIDHNTKVCIIHPEYGEFWQTPYDHLRNDRKKFKGKINPIKLNKETFISISNEKHSFKYDYSKVEYVNCITKVCIICPEHGEFWQPPHDHLKGHGCKLCSIEERSRKKKYTTEEFIQKCSLIHNNKYDYTKTEYTFSDEKVCIICPKHGEFWQIATDHIQGCGCPRCATHVSSYEEELYNEISKIYNGVILRNQRILDRKEIDIYIPEEKIAFEINGLLWHSEKCKTDKYYHINKTEMCKKNGISLIHIFEDEWVYKKEIIISMLKNIFKKNTEKIYARKCVVKKINPKECMVFLDENHLQGRCKANFHYGLFYNNELVSVMTFGKTRQQRKYNENYDDTYELLRFCSKIGFNVVGGASKLLTHFINETKPKEIITYADRRWSEGNLYNKLGFIHTHNSKPNYFYVFGLHRKNRFNFRKSVLVKQGFDKNKSEHEIMLERGIYRIYDCGTMVFKKKIN